MTTRRPLTGAGVALLLLLASAALGCRSKPQSEAAPPETPAPEQPTSALTATPVTTVSAGRVDPPAQSGAMAPHLSAGPRGLLLSWLEPLAEGGHRLQLARFSQGEWSPPTTVVTDAEMFANWADVPSVVETDGGVLVAHWLSRVGTEPYAYGIRIRRSDDGARTWRDLGLLHRDGTATEHGFVSLVAEGEAVRAIWLDGRQMAAEPPGPMTLRTALIGTEIGQSSLLDDRVCDCCQTDAVRAGTGLVAAYRDRSDDEVRDISVVREGADDWSSPALVHADGWRLSGCPVNGPAVAAAGNRIAAAWSTGAGGESEVRLAWSANGGAEFAEPIVLDAADPLGRVDVTLTSSGDALVSWLARRPGEAGADAELRIRRVDAAGRTAEPVRLATTAAARASGFPQMMRSGDGVLVVWVTPEATDSLRAVWIAEASLPAVAAGS